MNLTTSLMIAAVVMMPATAFAQKGPQQIQDVDDAVRNAVSVQLQCAPGTDIFAITWCSTNSTIPPGYRLAVTQVSVQVDQPPAAGAEAPWLALDGSLNGQPVRHTFTLSRAVGRWMASMNTFFVIDQGPADTSFVFGAQAPGVVVISGYLIKL
jgi:hypothetical protein